MYYGNRLLEHTFLATRLHVATTNKTSTERVKAGLKWLLRNSVMGCSDSGTIERGAWLLEQLNIYKLRKEYSELDSWM
jgi:hypothetical protein